MSSDNENDKSILLNITDSLNCFQNVEELVGTISDEIKIVLLGECTHGTEEFYQIRSDMTKLLIEKHNYKTILVEGDWPCFYKINKYVTSKKCSDKTALESMKGIKKFPLWMWRNKIMLELVEWLRNYNLEYNKDNDLIRILGLDCYSLLYSKKWLIAFLKLVDEEYSKKIKLKLDFLKKFKNEKDYIKALLKGHLRPYFHQIRNLFENILSEIQWKKMDEFSKKCNELKIDSLAPISAEQCCEVMISADEYYRKLYLEPRGSNASWNTRDQHMTMTIMRLKEHLKRISKTQEEQKIIVWAHNSHVKDAMATNNGSQTFEENNAWNLGQMVRSMYGKDKVKIFGFYTHKGTVTASEEWGQPCKKFELKESLEGSCERYFHEVCKSKDIKQFFINTDTIDRNKENFFTIPRLQRYVGVNYCPETELQSHYSEGKIGDQYDVIVYVDETKALEELDKDKINFV